MKWPRAVTDNGHSPRVDVFVRHDCGLCEQLVSELKAYFDQRPGEQPVGFSIREIEDRSDWLRHYTDHVPVVVVDGEEVCHYFLDIDALEDALACP